MQVKTQFKCRCNISTIDLIFRRPEFMGHTLVPVKCKDCESEYIVKFKRTKVANGRENMLQSYVKVVKLSSILMALAKEEEEYKNGENTETQDG